MDREVAYHHFHVRWGTGTLDWERHYSRADAERAAKELARPDEKYTIEERDGKCSACIAQDAEERASG